MDNLALQRSLSNLEQRYRELRELGEKREGDWQVEADDFLRQIDDLKKQLEFKDNELTRQLENQYSELHSALSERDAIAQKEADVLGRQILDLTAKLKSIQKDGELTLLQLHQVQEELEYYYQLSRKQQQLIVEHSQLHAKATALLLDKID